MEQHEQLHQGRKLMFIYGSPTPPGRTTSLLYFLENEVNETYTDVSTEVLTPSQYQSSSLYYWESSIHEKIEEADAIIVASPVYRASMPAILKQLFDELPVRALRSKPVGLISVGNIAEHYLGVERHFYDILSWFGSLYVPATCYVIAPSLNKGINSNTKTQLKELMESTLYLADRLNHRELGPMPLAEIHGR